MQPPLGSLLKPLQPQARGEMRNHIAPLVGLAALLGSGMAALAQQANGPPISIAPPASVYRQAPPSPAAPPRATAPRLTAAPTTTRQTTAPRDAATPATATKTATPATATNAAAILHATGPGALDCGDGLVVWANLATHIYHFSTSEYYGHTKVGSYMCENDAKAEGMRPGRTEVRP